MKPITIHRAAAFSLVEVTLALGVAGFCLLAVFGLLPIGLQSNQSALERTNANALLTAIVSDLRATQPTAPPGSAATSNQYAIAIPASGSAKTSPDIFFSDARQLVATAAAARYRVSISFLAPPQPVPSSGVPVRLATIASIKVNWPAYAATANSAGSVQIFTALDRN